MSWETVSDSVCPIARTLTLIGDRWTLLLLREMVMKVHRFDELQAQTSMSSHLLTARLRRMERDGIIERRPYCRHPVRYEYHPTAKGRELDPLLVLMRSWGRKWEGDLPPGEPAFTLVEKTSGKQVDELWDYPGGGAAFSFTDVAAVMGPAFEAERTARRSSFHEAQRAQKFQQSRRRPPSIDTAVPVRRKK